MSQLTQKSTTNVYIGQSPHKWKLHWWKQRYALSATTLDTLLSKVYTNMICTRPMYCGASRPQQRDAICWKASVLSYRRGVFSFLSYIKVRHKSHIVRYVIFTKYIEVYTFLVRYNKVRRRYYSHFTLIGMRQGGFASLIILGLDFVN